MNLFLATILLYMLVAAEVEGGGCFMSTVDLPALKLH